jgi:hypothetical protein
MDNIEITRADQKDIDQLQQVSRQTFYETFSASNTEENMNKYLNEGFRLKGLQES